MNQVVHCLGQRPGANNQAGGLPPVAKESIVSDIQSLLELPSVREAGIVPSRTDDAAEARRRVEADGAVILTGLGRDATAAVDAARAIFADRVLAIPPAAEVRSGGVMDQVVRRVGPEEALGVHTDGFSYGDQYPDYFLLLCAQDSAEGGESFFVDGYRLLDSLGADDAGAPLVEAMHTVPVDQTEDGMHRAVSPLVGRTSDGRRMVRRFPFQRPTSSSSEPQADAAMIDAWDRLCRTASQAAPRFKLAPGEVAVIDNYRMLHGREPYNDIDRLMWRVWVWTDAGNGVPAGSLASDTRYARVPTAITASEWPMITAESASCVPATADSPLDGAALLAATGAAIIGGVSSLEDAVATARTVLGDRAVRVKPQFEATAAGYLADQARLATSTPDRLGRVRRFTPPDEVMPPHNDGYGFGDLAPDHIFLWCETPDATGGASWLLDGSRLLASFDTDPDTAELAAFCRDEPIDHSEPGFIANPPAPIARQLPSGRQQVRHNPYLAPVEGPSEATHAPMVAAWCDAVVTARDRAQRFSLQPGQLLCIDNYRMLHGRDGFGDQARKVVSIWGWTTDAVDIPDRDMHLV
jgi:gamma-butyrobetaine dioxygenase